MDETLRIKNFLVLKDADISVKRVNLLIGPQANGKSLIAKLLSFFSTLSEDFVEAIRIDESKRSLDKSILTKFELSFPRYSWDGTSFSITYKIDSLEFIIKGEKSKNNKTFLSLSYSDDLAKKVRSKKLTLKRKLDEERLQISRRTGFMGVERRVLNEHVKEPLSECYPGFFSDSFFIPASRSFFANLQKNIFTFLASNLDIDPYLKEFGQLYENSKFLYREDLISDNKKKQLIEKMRRLIESVVQGKYEYHDEQDWIVSKGKRINLANASSGQQESLPMLLVLAVWSTVYNYSQGTCFIEEPEAHLFPLSQGRVMSILSLLYKETNLKFFITTHSPYIVTALNNFVLAYDVIEKGAYSEEEFRKLNGGGCPINFEDISAYTVVEGKTSSIVDSDLRIVGADMLDEISEHFENVTNSLLLGQ